MGNPLTHFSAGLMGLGILTLTGTGCQHNTDTLVHLNFDVEWNGDPYTVGESRPDIQGRPANDSQLTRLLRPGRNISARLRFNY